MFRFLTLFALLFAVAFAQKTYIRVAHMSPDAPGVDIYVNDSKVDSIDNTTFPQITDYLELDAATYNIKVVATGTGVGSPVIDVTVAFAADTAYTVTAMDELANIFAKAFVDTTSAPPSGKARVRFIHASPDAPNVDIRVIGGPDLTTDLGFPNASDYIEVNTGTYDLQIVVAGTDTVALNVTGVALANADYTVFARGLLADLAVSLTQDSLAAFTTAAPEVTTTAAAPVSTSADTNTYIRVAHMSPNAPGVDIYVNDSKIDALDNTTFPMISGYLTVPAATYNLKVVPSGSGISSAVIDVTGAFAGGQAYTAAAVNTLANVEALLLADKTGMAPTGKAGVRFIHASPDAPAVNIRVAGSSSNLVSNLSFKQYSDYIEVPVGTYDLQIVVASNNAVALNVTGVALSNYYYDVFARGLVSDLAVSLVANQLGSSTVTTSMPGAAGHVAVGFLPFVFAALISALYLIH